MRSVAREWASHKPTPEATSITSELPKPASVAAPHRSKRPNSRELLSPEREVRERVSKVRMNLRSDYRELPSAHPTTGAPHETLPITGTGPALSRSSRPGRSSFPAPTVSAFRCSVSSGTRATIPGLAQNHHSVRSIRSSIARRILGSRIPHKPVQHLLHRNLTMPVRIRAGFSTASSAGSC